MKKVTEGQKLKLAVTLVENVGWDKLDGDSIQSLIADPSGTGKKGTEWLANGAKLQMIVGNHVIDLDADPYLPNGWNVESHTKGGQVPFNPEMVSLYLVDEQKGGTIQGHKLRQKLEAKNSYNANLLDFYLAHPELIPESWKGKYVFFWGTIYRNADGSLYVRCLDWGGRRWCWSCGWLDGDWSGYGPAAVRSK